MAKILLRNSKIEGNVILNAPIAFWRLSNTLGKTITNFSSVFTGNITVDWGDGSSQLLTSNTPLNKTLGNTIGTYLKGNKSNITQINCGSSSPRLGGTVDISAFPNLTTFICNSNDITSFSGYNKNSKLQTLQFFDNKISGQMPSLSEMTNLVEILFHQNEFTGSIPSLNGLTKLSTFFCFGNQFTGNIPELNNLPNFLTLHCSSNLLTGNIPSLSVVPNLINLYVNNNQLSGPIPSLSNNTKLIRFFCGNNLLTGNIPSFSGLNNFQEFRCEMNQLTGFAGGSVSNTLGNFHAQNNQLTSTAVNAILAAFVVANKTTGNRTLLLAGTGNAAPIGQGLTDKATLIARGWTVTTN